MKKQAIRTERAPVPTGPFNQAIRIGNMVFTSGQAGRNRETGQMGDIRDQARRCIGNIAAILETAGASLADVVKVTVFLEACRRLEGLQRGICEADAGAAAGAQLGDRHAQERRHAVRDGMHRRHPG